MNKILLYSIICLLFLSYKKGDHLLSLSKLYKQPVYCEINDSIVLFSNTCEEIVHDSKINRNLLYRNYTNPDSVFRLKICRRGTLSDTTDIHKLNLKQYKNLQELDISENVFKTFPTEICSLSNLQILHLEWMCYADICKFPLIYKAITPDSIVYNFSFPKEFFKLKKLKILYLDYMQAESKIAIKQLHDNFPQLKVNPSNYYSKEYQSYLRKTACYWIFLDLHQRRQ